AAAFARWTAVAANRVTRQSDTRHLGRTVPIRGINETCERWPASWSSLPPIPGKLAAFSVLSPGNE
ncbi:hypothetical protein, partial [Mycolicibacterium vanbaalenii]|uniref:hypothetical protein n=1 Tax=Mycolicibacterium vanbaalenii TaxID=110539 RepID=UPI0021F2611F